MITKKNKPQLLRIAMVALVLAAPAWLLPTRAFGQVGLPEIFSDRMVLQQGKPIPIWGTADAHETIAISIDKQSITASADADGQWSATLAPLSPGGPFEIIVKGSNTVTVHDVLVGEVWLCSGQSNMAMLLKEARDGPAEMEKADNPQIRLCTVGGNNESEPLPDARAYWFKCSPKEAGAFSAVPYFFARHLQQSRNVPVGVVMNAVSGTEIKSWISEASLIANPLTKPAVDEFITQHSDYPAAERAWKTTFAEHQESQSAARLSHQPLPKMPERPAVLKTEFPAGHFNSMVAPLRNFPIAGCLWYQGESDVEHASRYRAMLNLLIKEWRAQWHEEIPFFVVQLPGLGNAAEIEHSQWAALREAQAQAVADQPHAVLVSAVDLGEANNLHPKNKQEVGRRLAVAAEAVVYGEKAVWSGPVYESMKVEGSKIRVRFTNAEGGLFMKGDSLAGFVISGADGKLIPATATIDGDTVVVQSPMVSHPAAVRYAWADFPATTLYNKADLPALPFRSDESQRATRPE